MSGHTPVPWVADSWIVRRGTPDADGKRPALCSVVGEGAAISSDEDDANVLFIVQACNSHDELVTAATDLLKALKWLARGEHEWSAPPQAIDFMERAIAKAEAKTLSPFVSPVGPTSPSY